jgi:hypothetical protein
MLTHSAFRLFCCAMAAAFLLISAVSAYGMFWLDWAWLSEENGVIENIQAGTLLLAALGFSVGAVGSSAGERLVRWALMLLPDAGRRCGMLAPADTAPSPGPRAAAATAAKPISTAACLARGPIDAGITMSYPHGLKA